MGQLGAPGLEAGLLSVGRGDLARATRCDAEALRQSMLAMIDRARSDYEANPTLWALFVVVGEPARPQ
jgi:hypothetical protein